MEIHPFCKECLKKNNKWELTKDGVWLIGPDGDKELKICDLIREKKVLPAKVKEQFDQDELDMIDLLSDPIKWSGLEFGWEARWYQDAMLRCTASRKVNRIGRRCLTGDTPVLMNDGSWKNIKDILVGDVVVTRNKKNQAIGSKVLDVFNNGVQEVYRIYFSNGSYLDVTSNHPILSRVYGVNGKNKKSEWVSIDDGLEAGMHAYMLKGFLKFGTESAPEEAKLLGYLLTDGYIAGHGQTPKFTSCDEIYIKEVSDASIVLFGEQGKIKKRKESRALDIHLTDGNKGTRNKCLIWLDKYNLVGKKSRNKFIPKAVYMWDKSSVAFFVNRLFSGDGCASVWKSAGRRGAGELSLTSCNESLLNDVRLLLLKFSVNAIVVKEKTRNNWKLRISDKQSIVNFFNHIGLVYGKEKKCKELLDNVNKRTRQLRVGNKSFRLVRIRKIEKIGMKETFDISVATHHNFIANGFCTHNSGKTETLCVKMLHYAYTNEFTSSLVIAPYKNQVGLIFDRLDVFLAHSPAIKASVKRNTKNPYRIQFHNGSKIVGFTSGTRTGAKSTGIRGQDAHAIFIDEADYLGESDFEVILAILASRPDCLLWASSTPTGKREMYWRWCSEHDLGFKEFHYPSSVSPSWTAATERLERAMYSDQGYSHEFEAEFGEEAEGVFLNKYIDTCMKKYTLGKIRKNPKSLYTMGVDWNSSATGTHIIVTEWNEELNNGNGAFRPVEKIIISQVEFTQTVACEEIIRLNEKWDPIAIYVDQGFGYAQIEMLHKYGLSHPKTGLVQKVKGINFGDRIEIIDPAIHQKVKKHIKPFMVNLCVKRVEDGHIILPESEDIKHGLVGQMRDYTVIRRTAVGQPIFRDEDDHTLVAWMLSVYAATMERSDMIRFGTVPHIAIGGKLGESFDKDFVINRKKVEALKRENSAIIPRWPVASIFNNETTQKASLDVQKDKQRTAKKRKRTVKDFRRQRAGKVGRASF